MTDGFSGAIGTPECVSGKDGVRAMEMTKWFDTNYHYMVPEFREGQRFTFVTSRAIDDFQEGLASLQKLTSFSSVRNSWAARLFDSIDL